MTNTFGRLWFITEMHPQFQRAVYEQTPQQVLWSIWSWAYLMGEEL